MRVYAPCIGGLPGVVLDGSMHALAKRLNEASPEIEAEVFPWFLWKKARKRCIEAHKEGALIAGAGHSYGCLEWSKISIDLMKHNIAIKYIGGIDATATPPGYGPMVIDGNVAFVDEFWASFGWPSMARLRSPAGSKGGKFVYPYGTHHKIHRFTAGHIAVAARKAVQKRIVDQIRELLL